MQDVMRVDRAIVSVFDKSNLQELASGLFAYNPGIEIISTGGTADKLKGYGHPVTEAGDFTGVRESPRGYLKTIHPRVAGGILLDGDFEDERAYMEAHKILPIGLVVVNFYPLARMIAEGKSIKEIRIYGFDIGGPNMVRAAIKSFLTVAVVTDPTQYEVLLRDLQEHQGTTLATRLEFAQRAMRDVELYDEDLRKWIETLTPDEVGRFYLGLME